MAGWIALLLPLLIYVLTLDGTIFTNGIDASIIGTQYALWKFGSFSIGTPQNLLINTVDYGVYQGKAYSAIAPGTALLSYPFASIGFILSGSKLRLPGPAQVADELFLAIAASIAVYSFYRICRLYADDKVSLLLALVMAFGTPVWPFTTIVFENSLSLMFSVIAVYFVLKSAMNPQGIRLPLAGGLSLGLASFVEYAAGLFVVPLAVFEWYRTRSWRNLTVFVSAFLIGPIANAVYNFILFRNPLIFPEQLKSGTAQPVGGLLSAFNIWSAPIHMLYYLMSPYRGVLFLAPILVFGLFALYLNWSSVWMQSESLLFLSLFCLVLVFYSAWSDWAGGLAYGPRFLTTAVPYMLIPLAPFLSKNHGGRWWALTLGLFVYSSFIQGAGALTSAFSVYGDWTTFQPLALNLSWLLQGKIDSWWILWNGLNGTLFPLVFEGGVYLLIWTVVLLLAKRPATAPT